MIISDLCPSNSLCNPNALDNPHVGMGSYRATWTATQPTQPAGGVPTNNPADPSFNWTFFDSAVAQAAQFGKKAWLRIAIQGASSPGWLQAIVQQYTGVKSKLFNVWWDPNYQAYIIALIQACGARYSSNPVVSVFTTNLASDNVGDWTVPNVAASVSATGAGNWTVQNSFTCPAYNASVVVTPNPNQEVDRNSVINITGFGWFLVTAVTGSTNNATSATLLNLAIAGNANSGTVAANTIMFYSDVAGLQGPLFRYTTAKFATAVEAVISAEHTAFPTQVIDQEVGRSGTLDPFPAAIPAAASAPVQQSIGSASGANPYTKAYTSNVTAGNTLVAAVTINSNTPTISSFTDTLNAAQWSFIGIVQAQNRSLAIYQFRNTLGGACTVSVTWSATGTVQMALFELSGSNVIVDIQANSNGSATTSVVTPWISPAYANELVIAFNLGGTGQTGQAGWTFQTAGASLATQYILPGSFAPITATFTQASAAYVSMVVAFSGGTASAGTTKQYNAATQICQWAYANITSGSFASEKCTFEAPTELPATALANQDGSSFYLPAQTKPGSTNTSGTTGTIPVNSLFYGQFAWHAYDPTGQYSPVTTASALGPYTANGGKPYVNPIPVFQQTIATMNIYGCVVLEVYELDIINVLPVAGSFSGNTNSLSAQANFSSQQALTACRSTPGGP